MKRSPLKRKTPLKARGRERGTPNQAFRSWIREQRCAIVVWGHDAGRSPLCGPSWFEATEAAHLPRVKQHGDVQNLIPLCGAHHREQHRIGVQSFAAKYGLDLQGLALWYWERWEEMA